MQQKLTAPRGAKDGCVGQARSSSRPSPDKHLSAALLALGLAQVIMWGVAAGLSYSSVELDSAEQLSWGTTLELGYWKHPPLPSWIMHAALTLIPPSVVLPLVMAQAAVVIALALSWRLAREMLPQRQAALSVLLTSLILYHNAGADSFNHNTVLLPFQAATTLAFYLAVRRSSLPCWIAAGLFAGLSILVKYVAILHITGLLLYLVLDRSARSRCTFAGVLLGGSVLTLVISPHLYWLQASGYPPMQYARSVMQPLDGIAAAFASMAGFLQTQCFRLLPMLLLLAYMAHARQAAPMRNEPDCGTATSGGDRLFIWVVGLAPLLMTVLFSLMSGSRLEARWGANAFLCAGLLAVMVLRPRLPAERLRTAMALTLCAHLVLCAGLVLGKSVIADHFGKRTRANFPAAELAQETGQVWRTHTGAPLRIVATDIWLGGNLRASGLPGVSVLIDGDYTKSPWIRPGDIDACGVMVIEDAITDSRAGTPLQLKTLMAGAAASGAWTLTWGGGKHERRTVRWAFLAPHDAKSCPK
ncbi:glycosyltransferase family 39 protein [Pseudoduganella sp. UC29_106]|uniref:glycosyltransferase family 39 protein n=1 Tax=Pseudoduganella sp. UC29_106 TaxID=3374553 RepID=UPI0037570B2C